MLSILFYLLSTRTVLFVVVYLTLTININLLSWLLILLQLLQLLQLLNCKMLRPCSHLHVDHFNHFNHLLLLILTLNSTAKEVRAAYWLLTAYISICQYCLLVVTGCCFRFHSRFHKSFFVFTFISLRHFLLNLLNP